MPSVDNGGNGLVAAILQSFWENHPEFTEQMELLQVIASVCGHADVLRLLGSAVCMSDGSRELKLVAVAPVAPEPR